MFSLITGIETNMLLILFLGLIVNLTLVCGNCGVGTGKVNDFDWSNVRIGVLT
jgi:hypothetical protein